ncbi:hypothetical protein KD050_19080 [Psychrobacillus sp. INOP01]|uniref:hypothetical protein n=1 Tax=Psychrobacillus sp. INOP01 TaxID=2829187 RepID=UPI001BA671B3|nr:hypothetical protein [Psychrobacillus sp. INOP01]QUG41353.1 hypothetical protein KD050_19080 [Psychrobacillus sp. INOP01]
MKLIIAELKKLINDYYRCNNYQLKEQILIDINLLKEALRILEKNNIEINTKRSLGF